jgi:hypothetical protein
MISYYWFSLFAILLYLIAIDKSLAKTIYLLTQLVRVEYEKVKWWILHNPRNPIVKYLMWRRSMKLAKEMMNMLESKND